MNKPAGLVYTRKLFKPKLDIPKSLMAFGLIIHVCSGVNFGFIKKFGKRLQMLGKCLTFLVTLGTAAVLSIPVIYSDTSESVWFCATLIQYVIYISILNVTKYNFYDLLINLLDNHEDIAELKAETAGVLSILYTIFIYAGKNTINYIYCKEIEEENCGDSYQEPYALYFMAVFSLDVVSIIFILINYYMYSCVKTYKVLIESNQLNCREITEFYVSLADCYDKIRPVFDKLITVELLFEIPKLMRQVYFMLLYIKAKESWVIYLAQVIYVVPIIIHILVPSIIAEMLNSQMDDVKIVLNRRILDDEDDKSTMRIQKLLQYMQVRRLEHNVWRIIPVNMGLPLAVASMCVTYLIVIIQFTHLYD